MDTLGWIVQVVLRPREAKGFVLVKKRWIVERTFGWWRWSRRLVQDYEQLPENIEVLGWFDLMENLHKVQMLNAERKALRHHLWQGGVEQVWPILKGMRCGPQADCF